MKEEPVRDLIIKRVFFKHKQKIMIERNSSAYICTYYQERFLYLSKTMLMKKNKMGYTHKYFQSKMLFMDFHKKNCGCLEVSLLNYHGLNQRLELKCSHTLKDNGSGGCCCFCVLFTFTLQM